MSTPTMWSREWDNDDMISICDLHLSGPGVIVGVCDGLDGASACVTLTRSEWMAGVMQAAGITRAGIEQAVLGRTATDAARAVWRLLGIEGEQ